MQVTYIILTVLVLVALILEAYGYTEHKVYIEAIARTLIVIAILGLIVTGIVDLIGG